MTETRTYSSKSNAIRAARAALKDKVTDPMSGVHFKLEQTGDEWAWHEIDVQTGEIASGEHVEDGVVEPAAPVVEAEAPVRAETRDEKRLRKIAEADARNRGEAPKPAKAGAAKPAKADKAPKEPKAGGVVATKVSKLLELVQSPEGLTEPQLKSITGWSKFGGFYAAAKQAGIKMERTKVDGVNVWKAAA